MFGKARKAAEQMFERMSRCASCQHATASAGCRCARSDCACGTAHNR